MPIDASIYQNIRPVEIPDVLSSAGKAMTLSALVRQNRKMTREEDDDAAVKSAFASNTSADGTLNQPGVLSSLAKLSPEKYLAVKEQFAKTGREAGQDQAQANALHLQKASMFGQALESISRMAPDARAQAYPQVRNELIQGGVITPDKLPEQYDDGLYRQNLFRYQQSKDFLENQKTLAETDRLKADAVKARAEAGKGGRKPLPASDAVSIGGANAAMKALGDVSGMVSENAGMFGPAVGLYDKAAAKLGTGQTGRDASTINGTLRQRAQIIGRYLEGGKLTDNDIERYTQSLPQFSDAPEVAQNKISGLQRLIAQKQAAEKQALAEAGYDVGGIQSADIPDLPRTSKSKENPPPSVVRMMGPDGRVRPIPVDQVGEAIAAGGKKVR